MNKCIRCGKIPDKDDKFILYKESKNIYYGEYLCFDCKSMINAEWDLDKFEKEVMMRTVKIADTSVMEFLAKLYEDEWIQYKNMLSLTGDKKEAFDLMRNNTKALEETEAYQYVQNELLKEFGDGEE